MFKKFFLVTFFMFFSMGAVASNTSWNEFLKNSLKNSHFVSVIYQYKDMSEYKEFKEAYNNSGKGHREMIERLAEENHPLGLYIMSQYYHGKGKEKKFREMYERLYIISDDYSKSELAKFMATGVDENVNKGDAGYLGFYIKNHNGEYDPVVNERYLDAISRFGEFYVSEETLSLETKLYENIHPSSHYSFNAAPPDYRTEIIKDSYTIQTGN